MAATINTAEINKVSTDPHPRRNITSPSQDRIKSMRLSKKMMKIATMQDAKHRIKSLIISKPGAKPKEPHAHEGSNDSDEECEDDSDAAIYITSSSTFDNLSAFVTTSSEDLTDDNPSNSGINDSESPHIDILPDTQMVSTHLSSTPSAKVVSDSNTPSPVFIKPIIPRIPIGRITSETPPPSAVEFKSTPVALLTPKPEKTKRRKSEIYKPAKTEDFKKHNVFSFTTLRRPTIVTSPQSPASPSPPIMNQLAQNSSPPLSARATASCISGYVR
jgi:hypothetical protein